MGARRAQRARRAALDTAREAHDVTAAERVVLEALANRFGEQVRALPADELARALAGRLPDAELNDVIAWLDAAQQARYAPSAGGAKRGLFDDAATVLTTIEGES